RATCAIAQSPGPITDLPGTPRGKLSVIGIGPGSDEWRSPEATHELISASDWVGYDLYLDLVANLKTSQTEHRFGLGKEEARVRHAFNLAGQGRDVALVCSGDAAIYAMAALVYEVLDSNTLTPPEQRVEIKTLPGISAFQAASARAGALIGHDFCTISLSDLLTPWATIEQRLQAAAEGDFNIAFYNPRSLKRTDQLQKAIDILKPHRPPETPVIIASNLGRLTEKVKTVAFKDFNPTEVDMLTIVLIGSSQSKILTRGDGKAYCFTPRGYANKKENLQ
ncbi:Cobalamin biosynthesis protein CbiG / Cobalt-precorrin-3b C17-methyltransferase, partial [hydrothermal vent metagenome]